MPTKDAVAFRNPGNAKLMDYIKDRIGGDYAQRVPNATQASVRVAFEKMWENEVTRNQFVDALVNLIGMQLVKYNIWNNPLAKFKRGLLTYGDTIEEVMVGLLNAYVYDQNRDYLEKDIFGSEPNEVQSRFHKINRENFYKLTIKEDTLKRAFYNEGGLSGFVAALMASLTTSDQWDEFLLMAQVFSIYDAEGGFYKIQTPDLTDLHATQEDAKDFLKTARALLDTLPFLSRDYNAAHMPVSADPSKLIMITTPEAKANMDVEALAAAFNVGLAEIATKIIVLPGRYIKIPGFQALITTEDFFIVADTKLETRSQQNPVGLITNYFLHHWQVISASPFVPAVVFTSEPVDVNQYIDPAVSGINPIVLTDMDGNAVTSVTRGDAILVSTTATTNLPAGTTSDVNEAVTWTVEGNGSTYTRVSQTGILFAGFNETSGTIDVIATSVTNPDFSVRTTVPVTGELIVGSIGMTVDDDTTQIAVVHLPTISSADGTAKVGQVFTADPGEWDTEGLTFAYAWKLDGTPIAGATSESYTAQAGDATHALSVTVTPSKTGYTLKAAATSRPVTLIAAS
jgi:hypothetical protein